MIQGYTTKPENMSFTCDKCGKEIKPRAFYFTTEEEIKNFFEKNIPLNITKEENNVRI